MPNGDRALDFEAILKTTDFKKELGDLERRITGFASKAVSETKKVDDTFSKLTAAAAGIFAANQLSELPGQIIKVRGEYQNLEIALTTILKSKSAADKVLADGAKLAATTPFTFTEVGQGIKQLLAYGSSASNVVNEVRTLGDVAAGVSAPLGDLIYLYGTLRTQGRAYATDIQQFAGRGIPIYEELGKVLKINTSEVRGFVEAGKVGFKEVEQVFKNLTSSGGQFEGLTQKTSKSLTGLLSNLQDSVDQAFNKIGQSQEGLLASGILTATELVNNYEKIVDVLKVVVATYGAYRAALLVTTAIQSASAIGGTISMWLDLAKNIRTAADAQIFFNLATKANPYVILATGIAALIAYLYVYSDETQKIVTSTELLADANKNVASQVRTQRAEIDTLVSTLKNQNVAESVRLEAYEKLKAISPEIVKNLTFEQAKTADLTKEVNNYTLALEKSLKMEALRGKLKIAVEQQIAAEENKILAEKELKNTSKGVNGLAGVTTGFNTTVGGFSKYDLAVAKVKDSQSALTQANKTVNEIIDLQEKILTKSTADQAKERIKNLELLRDSYGRLTPEYKKYEDQINSLNKQLTDKAPAVAKSFTQKLAEANDVGNLLLLKSQAKTENEIDALSKKIDEKKKDLDKSSGDYKRLQKAYEQLNPKKSDKKPEEVFPFGSLKYWEQVSKKAQEVIEKTPSTNTAVIEQQQKIRLNAEEQAEKIRQSLVKRSFDEELDYKRQQYELYNSWVVYQGKAAADGQFAELVKSGTNYREFLQNQISKLESKLTAGTATTQDKTNLVKAKVALDIDNESFDKYKNRIIDAGNEVSTLTDYLRILKQEQDKLSGGDVDKAKFLAEEIVATERKRQQLFQQFIIDNNVAGKQELQVQSYYSDLRTQLDKENADKKTAFYQEALAKINEEEKKALAERAADEVTNTDKTYKELEKIENKKGQELLKQKIANVKKQQDILTKAGAKESEAYKDKIEEQKKLEQELLELRLDSYNQLAGVLAQIGSDLQGLGGDLGKIGSLFISIGNSIPKISSLLSGSLTPVEAIGQGLQQVSDLIITIANNRKFNKQFEESYYNSIIAQQAQYNLLLNEELRLNSIKNENGFVRNYKGIVSDGLAALDNAKKLYAASLGALVDGKAKDGIKKVVEFQDGLKGALLGGIGSLAVQLFGKKDQDIFAPILQKYPELIKTLIDGTKEFNSALAQTLIDNNQVDDATKTLLKNTIDSVKAMEEAQKQITEVIIDLTGQLGSVLRDNLVNAFKDGTSAAQAFGDSVGQILENIISQTLFSAVFGQAFDNLKKDFEASFSATGDGVLTDDLIKFYKDYPQLVDVFTKGLSDAKAEAEKAGLDIFKKGTGSSSSSGLSGAVKGITEETAGLIAGQFNALRITSASTLQVNRDQLLALTNISNNSNFLKKLDLLESIDRKLSNNDLRAGGVG